MTKLPQKMYIIYYDDYRNNISIIDVDTEDKDRYCNTISHYCCSKEHIIFLSEDKELRDLMHRDMRSQHNKYKSSDVSIKYRQDLKKLNADFKNKNIDFLQQIKETFIENNPDKMI